MKILLLLLLVLSSGCAPFELSLVDNGNGGYDLKTNGKLPRSIKVELAKDAKERFTFGMDNRFKIMPDVNVSGINIGGAFAREQES